MLLKLVSISGMLLTLVGGILLWKGSPSGYAPPFYANAEILNQLAETNRRMQRRQLIAIALIVIGSLLQGVSTLYS
jgi:hypothetical protein